MRRSVRCGAAAFSMAALSLTTGCAGFFVYPGSSKGGSSSTGNYVYVANANTETLAGFSVGTGTLTAVTGSPYALGFIPASVAVNPANTIVFVAGTSGINGLINSYAIGSGGALSLLASTSVGLDNEAAIEISPDGQWLLGLDQNGSAAGAAIVDEFQINSSTGHLTLGTGAAYTFPVGTAVSPRAIKFSPQNGALVFAAFGTAGDLVFTFNTSNGAFGTTLVPVSTGSTTASDNALAVSSDGLYLYIARSGTGGGLAAYSITGNGSLTPVSGSPLTTGTQPYSVVVNKAGTDVYVANRADNSISGFSVASSGLLTPLSGSAYSSGPLVTALAVDKSGNYLLAAANGGAPDLTLYRFDSTSAGKLDSAATVATGNDPTGPVALAMTH